MARKIVQFQYDAVNDTFTVLCDDGTLRCRKFTLTEDARSASEVGRATSDLERRALEACETMAAELNEHFGMAETVREAMLIGRESLAAKKGPWVVTSQGNVAAHTDGRSVAFWDNRKGFDHAACAAFVAEQNELEASRV